MRSRYMAELTTPEVEKYFADGGKTAFLPVGSVEMHGPHQPIGTDTIIAKAFALLLAQKANGLVLPELHYTWAGATDGFAGTISIDAELVEKIVEAIAVKCKKMGFERLALVSVHAPHGFILYSCVRMIYAKYLYPVILIDPYNPYCEETGKLFTGEKEIAKEASLALAGLHILGQPDLYSEEEMRYEDSAPAYPDSFKKLNRVARVGYFMQDPRQHACPSKYVSLEDGLEFLNIQAAYVAPVLDEVDKYVEISKEQQNKGWDQEE